MKTADESIKRTRKVIEDYEKRIKEETAKMENLTQGRRDQVMQQLNDAKQEVQNADQHLRAVCEQKRQKLAEEENVNKELAKLKAGIEATRRRITDIQEILTKCARKEKDGHVAYGNNIQALLDEIKKMRWRGEVIGPLGLYVKLRDPEKWAPLLRAQLGLLMTSFAVTNPQDREQLKNLLKKHNKCVGRFWRVLLLRRVFRSPGTQIIIGTRDLFDYSEGEPAPEVPTVLRALEVSPC
jgi:chromosome segregation ATPase